MGNCVVTVRVTGSHHNGVANDIDQLAAEFVDKLKVANNNVTAAQLFVGGDYDLLNTTARFPIKEQGQ